MWVPGFAVAGVSVDVHGSHLLLENMEGSLVRAAARNQIDRSPGAVHNWLHFSLAVDLGREQALHLVGAALWSWPWC